MNFAVLLVGLSGIVLTIILRRRMHKRAESRRILNGGAVGRMSKVIEGHQPRWIGAMELSRLMDAEPDLVVLRIATAGCDGESSRRVAGELVATLEEFEAGLAWFPLESKLAIYQMGGIGFTLARKLAAITAGRETLLLMDDAPLADSDPGMETAYVAGAPCN